MQEQILKLKAEIFDIIRHQDKLQKEYTYWENIKAEKIKKLMELENARQTSGESRNTSSKQT